MSSYPRLFSSTDSIKQPFIKASQSYNFNVEASAPFSIAPPPSLVQSHTNDANYSDSDSESNTTAVNSLTPFLIPGTDKSDSDIINSCNLSPTQIFTTPPFRRSSSLPTHTTAERALLKSRTSIRNESIHVNLAYWKTIWAMKFAGIKGEAMWKD